MAEFLARRILEGKLLFADVPKKLKDEVYQILLKQQKEGSV